MIAVDVGDVRGEKFDRLPPRVVALFSTMMSLIRTRVPPLALTAVFGSLASVQVVSIATRVSPTWMNPYRSLEVAVVVAVDVFALRGVRVMMAVLLTKFRR